jgi:hypothetical protein
VVGIAKSLNHDRYRDSPKIEYALEVMRSVAL